MSLVLGTGTGSAKLTLLAWLADSTMNKLVAAFFGLILISSFGYMYLLSSKVLHVHVLDRPQPSKQSIWNQFLRPSKSSTNWTQGLIGQRWKANATKQMIIGATRHYKSLVDSQPLMLRCSSCAIVSSSGYLRGKGAGKDIDHHACVIRLNMAPVEGYEADVGTRTNLRVMNFFMSRMDAETLPPGSRIMVWGLFRRKSYLENAMNRTKRLSANSTIYGQTSEGEMQAENLFANETGQTPRKTKSWLSTGWFTMMIARDICEDIHVYGMVPSDYCASKHKTDYPYHYYETPWIKECSTYKASEVNKNGGHRFITEKAIFARWALRDNISFHYPSWKLDSGKLLGKLDTPFVNSIGWLKSVFRWISS